MKFEPIPVVDGGLTITTAREYVFDALVFGGVSSVQFTNQSEFFNIILEYGGNRKILVPGGVEAFNGVGFTKRVGTYKCSFIPLPLVAPATVRIPKLVIDVEKFVDL